MPEIHVTDEQGTEHIFPDGSTPEMIAQVLKVKPPAATPAQPQQPGWSVSSVLTGTSPAHQAIDAASQTVPVDTSSMSGFARSVGTDLGAGAVRLLAPLAHPIDALGGMAKTMSAAMGNSGDAYDVAKGIVAPFVKNPSGEAVAALPQAALALAGGGETANFAKTIDRAGEGGGVAANVADSVKQYIRPTPAASVVPRTEMAARQLSAAVLPAGKDASNFIRAAQQEIPNVLDYAKRTGNPLNTQLEFSKAAQGYAQEVTNLKQQILDPVKDQLVKTTGTGFGDRMQEGPDTYSTLGKIDERIVNLNKQLDAPAVNSDDARRALASKTELQAEVRGLTNILRQNLAQSSGIPVDQIADLWKRVPRSLELANDTNAAVTMRMQEAGKADLKPIKVGELPSRTLNFVRGGPVPIADRAFQRAIAQFPGDAQPLPAISQPPPQMPTAPMDRFEQLLAIAREKQAQARRQY